MSENARSEPMDDPSHRLPLSENDVTRLLTEPSSDSRCDIVQKIGAGYNTGNFNEREIEIAEQIFRLLAKDTEVKVRRSISDLIKDNADAPRDIALNLAKDRDDSVALPVLQHSASLSEYDLVSIIEGAVDPKRLVAIARRSMVSERVSTALVETKHEHVVNELLSNEGARINENTYRGIVQDHNHSATVMAQIAKRENLPVTVAEKLLAHVSESVADQLRDTYRLHDYEVSRQTQSVRETATLKLLDQDASQEAHAALVNQMMDGERLTPSLILSSLCRGNVLFFEMALARMAGIPLHNAQILIHDKGGLGFAKLYEKTGLPESLQAATKLTLAVIKRMETEGELAGTLHFANRAIASILAEADGQEIDNLSYIIALIRQHGKAA